MSIQIRGSIGQYLEQITDIRRALHQIPECAFEEKQTSQFIYEFLEKLQPDTLIRMTRTGIKAVFLANEAEKTIAIRADMDALPVTEHNDCDYKSKTDGKMHACGHDGHMAMALMTAKHVAKNKEELRYNVVFLFQPAEESIGGARFMIRDGCLENPAVDEIYALHLWPDLPIGVVGMRAGPMLATVSGIHIEIIGQTSHGARPHKGKDALVAAAHIITAMQTIVSRDVDPGEPAVVTLGKITGGEASNIICDQVLLEGTVRTFNQELSKLIMQRIDDILKGAEQMFGVQTVNKSTMYFPTVNNPQELFDKVAQIMDNDEWVTVEPSTVAEDFAYYQAEIPGLYALMGINDGKHTEPLHSSKFDFDEKALLAGVEYYVRIVEIES